MNWERCFSRFLSCYGGPSAVALRAKVNCVLRSLAASEAIGVEVRHEMVSTVFTL